jgi:Holliday junction DNA helicase RuvB
MNKNTDWRPGLLGEYVGQAPLVKELAVEIVGSKQQQRPLNSMVFHGPGGLGKTTLCEIIAAERGLPPPIFLIGKACSHEYLTQVLGGLQSEGYDQKGFLVAPSSATYPIVVVDEAESVETELWELLHPALESDASGRRIMLGKEVVGRQPPKRWPIWLVHFTLIAITNFYGKLLQKAPATMTRFPIKYQFNFYSDGEIGQVARQYASKLGVTITDEAIAMLSTRCHGVPRAAVQYVRRAQDFLGTHGAINRLVMAKMFEVIGIDDNGLDQAQITYMKSLINIGNGRLGIEALASILSSDRETLERAIEPPLLRKGLVVRTAGGREITSAGRVLVCGKTAASPLYTRAI